MDTAQLGRLLSGLTVNTDRVQCRAVFQKVLSIALNSSSFNYDLRKDGISFAWP